MDQKDEHSRPPSAAASSSDRNAGLSTTASVSAPASSWPTPTVSKIEPYDAPSAHHAHTKMEELGHPELATEPWTRYSPSAMALSNTTMSAFPPAKHSPSPITSSDSSTPPSLDHHGTNGYYQHGQQQSYDPFYPNRSAPRSRASSTSLGQYDQHTNGRYTPTGFGGNPHPNGYPYPEYGGTSVPFGNGTLHASRPATASTSSAGSADENASPRDGHGGGMGGMNGHGGHGQYGGAYLHPDLGAGRHSPYDAWHQQSASHHSGLDLRPGSGHGQHHHQGYDSPSLRLHSASPPPHHTHAQSHPHSNPYPSTLQLAPLPLHPSYGGSVDIEGGRKASSLRPGSSASQRRAASGPYDSVVLSHPHHNPYPQSHPHQHYPSYGMGLPPTHVAGQGVLSHGIPLAPHPNGAVNGKAKKGPQQPEEMLGMGLEDVDESLLEFTSRQDTKPTRMLRRQCVNCKTWRDVSAWRRSIIMPGHIVCNKCGLYEKAHKRARPLNDRGEFVRPSKNQGANANGGAAFANMNAGTPGKGRKASDGSNGRNEDAKVEEGISVGGKEKS